MNEHIRVEIVRGQHSGMTGMIYKNVDGYPEAATLEDFMTNPNLHFLTDDQSFSCDVERDDIVLVPGQLLEEKDG
jgi:hypothetical protein